MRPRRREEEASLASYGARFVARFGAWTMRLALVAVFAFPARGVGQSGYSRAAVQGALLGQIVRFIEWPAGAFEGSSRALRIVVLGDGATSSTLRAFYDGKELGGRAVVVVSASRLADVRDPHIVLVTARGADELEATVARFAGRPVLVATERECGCAMGASLHFFLEGQNVRFELNRSALRRSGLSPSYHLLRYAAVESGCR